MKITFSLIIIFFSFYISCQERDTTIVLRTKNGEITIGKSQNSSKQIKSKSNFFQLIYFASEEVILEAEEKAIFSDKVFLEFVFDENCNLKLISIKKNGILNSFNKSAEQFSFEILEVLKKNKLANYFSIFNDENCGNVQLALRLNIK